MMKRKVISLCLAVVLLLGIGTAALAAPLTAPEEGQFVIFGDYGWPYLYDIGVGYAINDNLTIGGFYGAGLGVYAMLTFDPFVFEAQYNFIGLTTISGFYTFDLDPFTIGVGGGALIGAGAAGYLAVEAEAKLGDVFALYGQADYIFGDGFAFGVGASLTF